MEQTQSTVIDSTLPASRVAALVPGLNEAGRIGKVLEVLRAVPLLDEIIVIDDGSTDNMLDEINQASVLDQRIRVIRHETNLGKGQSLFDALHSTQASVILTLDADLFALKPQHVMDLIQPVVDGKLDMTVGLFRGGKFSTDLSHFGTPWLTGQRCLRRELFTYVSEDAASGYGFETALTIAAHQHKCKTRRVYLNGVSHPHSEFHRGFWQGVSTRAKMYVQILQAWHKASRGSQKRLPFKRILFVILILFLTASVLYNERVTAASMKSGDLVPLPIEGVKRLLVVAPHPDDETLGSGGLIQAVLAQGGDVRVVLMTNGDGQMLAPLVLEKDPAPKAQDYIYIGKDRQAETLAAMKELGLPAEKVYFLGYPDGATNILWLNNWNTQCPLYARFTKTSSSPYPVTFDPRADYCGSYVLDDLKKIIQDFRPDMISVPNPYDHHPDHRAAYNFTSMAVNLVRVTDTSYQVDVWGYLVHYGFYPQPRGLNLRLELLPPLTFSRTGGIWTRFDLTPGQEMKKLSAIRAYQTQQQLLGNFLLSFIRQNEIFSELPPFDLYAVTIYQEPLQEMGVLNTPRLAEPFAENTQRLVLASSDIVSWQVMRLGSQVWLGAQTRGRLLPELKYTITIKTPDGVTRVVDCSKTGSQRSANTFFTTIDLNQIGNPSVIGFSAEVSQEMILDRTAWHFITLW